MSTSCTLCCFLSVKKQKHDFHFFVQCVIKQLLDSVFCDIQNNQGLGKGYQLHLLALAYNPYLDLDYSGYQKNLIQ